jgi:hypothetical protein
MTASLIKSTSSHSAILNHSGDKTILNFGEIILPSGQRQCDVIVSLYYGGSELAKLPLHACHVALQT